MSKIRVQNIPNSQKERPMCQVSSVTCQVSHSFFLLQSCGASRWRVCYQWGLPRQVDKERRRKQVHSLFYLYKTETNIANFSAVFGLICNDLIECLGALLGSAELAVRSGGRFLVTNPTENQGR